MTRSNIVIGSLIVVLAIGVAPRRASADPAEARLFDFIGWSLRLLSPPDPCTPPDPCRFTLVTEIAPRQHPDVIQSFVVGRHEDGGRVFHPEFQLATIATPPDPCVSDATCPPGPPTKIGVQFDVVDPTRSAVVITIPAGYALQPGSDGTTYTLVPLSVGIQPIDSD